MKSKILLAYVTLISYSASLTACKSPRTAMPRKATNVVTPSNCLSPFKLARVEVNPGQLVSQKLTFHDEDLGGQHSLVISANGVHANADPILYYRIQSTTKADDFFDDTTVLAEVKVPHLAAGTYSVLGASCVDADRVNADTRSKLTALPTTSAPGYVARFDVYCGPLMEAVDSVGGANIYQQRDNTGKERMTQLLKAEFDFREAVEASAKAAYQDSVAYHDSQASMRLASTLTSPSQTPLLDLTSQVKALGKHGYALMVLSDYKDNFNRTVETSAAPKQVPEGQVALADASSCKSPDELENNQSGAGDQIDFTSMIDKDKLLSDPSKPAANGTNNSTSTSTNNTSTGTPAGTPPVDPEPPVKDKSDLKKAGIALITIGSVFVAAGIAGSLAQSDAARQWVNRTTQANFGDGQLDRQYADAYAKRQSNLYTEVEYREKLVEISETRARQSLEMGLPDDVNPQLRQRFITDGVRDKLGVEWGPVVTQTVDVSNPNRSALMEEVNDRLAQIDSFNAEERFKSDPEFSEVRQSMLAEQESLIRYRDSLATERINAIDTQLKGGFADATPGRLQQIGKTGAGFAQQNPKMIKGALYVGVLSVLLGIILKESAKLADAPTPEEALLNAANVHGANILSHVHKLGLVNQYILEEIAKPQ